MLQLDFFIRKFVDRWILPWQEVAFLSGAHNLFICTVSPCMGGAAHSGYDIILGCQPGGVETWRDVPSVSSPCLHACPPRNNFPPCTMMQL